MKVKNILLITSLLFVSILHSQSIGDKLPELIPPSPTVAALMKYEEIPVSNYTGIPNISIPLFNYKFPSHDIGLDVGLSYHSASTKLDEVASDIGLGWSLTGGGSISRSVRGMPDEMIESERYGIYRANTVSGINYYQIVLAMQNNGYLNIMTPLNFVNDNTPDAIKEYLWDIDTKGKYDTQHDLWQYNFNGNTGRFYIEKQIDGTLKIKTLDNNKLKIVNHYIPPSQSSNTSDFYKPTSFEIYDTKGYKYLFDVIEVTTNNNFTESTSQNNIMSMSINSETYNSAFHLSKIYDNNNNLLIEYLYSSGGVEHIINSSLTNSYPIGDDLVTEQNQIFNDSYGVLFGQSFLSSLYKPKIVVAINDKTYLSKKIEQIRINGVGSVLFNYETGRLDDDYINKANVKILKNITVKNLDDTIIKEFELEHQYINAIKKKLFLKKVKQISQNNTIDFYDLYYKTPQYTIVNPIKDSWGYLKNLNEVTLDKSTDKDLVSMFVLEKMVLPSKGAVVFKFESNTFSAVENEALTNFDENDDNWLFFESFETFNTISGNKRFFFEIFDSQPVYLRADNNFNDSGIHEWFFNLYKVEGITQTPVGGLHSSFQTNSISLLPGVYYVEFVSPNIPNNNNFSAKITAYYKKRKLGNVIGYQGDNNFLYGGGIRIASIETYEQNVNLNNNQLSPLSIKNYKYNSLDNLTRSSGVLLSKRPIFNYMTSVFRPELRVAVQGTVSSSTLLEQTYDYNVLTDQDKVNRGKTQGADIGYKNVTVSTLNNGRTEYTYTTSLEYPDVEHTIADLFLPSINYDYKRGLVKKEESFDNLSRKLNTRLYNYDFEDNIVITGLYVFGTYDVGYNSCPTFKLFANYNHYKNIRAGGCALSSLPCSLDHTYNTFREDLNLGYTSCLEAFGWAKLTSTINREYFYPSGSSMASIVETNQTYSYNPINKQIAESTTTNSNGEVLKTNYYYHTGNSIHSQNRISEIEKIETYRNSQLLSTSKINYVNNWGTNVSYLPQTIQSSKGANALETKVKYNKYDAFNNPLEVQQENGTKISYIWGYNNTQPVAKLENIAYDAIPASLITAIKSATDAPNATETSILATLDALRNNPDVNLQKAMITTYTYKPLVGITSVTDPKGDKQTYHYDSFNRLEFVKDKNENILSENKYHYRTQN